jgi:hypothetical protein
MKINDPGEPKLEMRREYPLTSFEIDSAKAQCVTVWYTLIFNDQGEMVVEEYRDFGPPFYKDSVTVIPPEKFDNYTVNGTSLRQLVLKKLEEIRTRSAGVLTGGLGGVPPP